MRERAWLVREAGFTYKDIGIGLGYAETTVRQCINGGRIHRLQVFLDLVCWGYIKKDKSTNITTVIKRSEDRLSQIWLVGFAEKLNAYYGVEVKDNAPSVTRNVTDNAPSVTRNVTDNAPSVTRNARNAEG